MEIKWVNIGLAFLGLTFYHVGIRMRMDDISGNVPLCMIGGILIGIASQL